MAVAGGGGGGQQADSGLGPLWVVLAVFVGAWLLWVTAHAYLVTAIFKIRLAEIAVYSLFSSGLASVQNQIQGTLPAYATFSFVAQISHTVGQKIAIPLALLLIVLGGVLYRVSSNNRYRRVYSMNSLMQQEKNNWPQITPIIGLNLLNTHIHEGPWAMCMTPMQFAKKHNLLSQEVIPDETGLANRATIKATIDQGKATRVFTRQLGRPWRGVDALPIHAKALFAIFIAKANADRGPATQLIRQISASASNSGKLDFSGAEALLKKHQGSKIAQKIISKHGYELTVMASMLEIARMDGVLATAEFIWLKPVDRSLWFMLNNVGRRTAFTEVSGPIAHWLAEKLIGRPLLVPMVQEATIALVDAVAEVIYNPEQDF